MVSLLILDDDTNLLEFLHAELSAAGYNVKSVNNGPDAIIAAAEERFDLMLIDMLMPGMDGIQVIRVLRKVSPDVPVIGLTGYVGRGFMNQAMEMGVRMLTKPVNIPELIKIIKDVVSGTASKN